MKHWWLHCKLNNFLYKRRFFVRQTLLLKYVTLWQRQQMTKTYDNAKFDFDCRANTGFCFTFWYGKRSKKTASKFHANCVTMFWVIEYFPLDGQIHLSLTSKHFHENLYSNSLYIVDITSHFYKSTRHFLLFTGIFILFW